MNAIDDPATVLEQFIHDVANLPAEVAHHMEEIQAKDQAMIESRNHISSRDAAIQRHVRNSGGQVKIPAEDKYIAAVKLHYEKALALQEEKCLLANKVAKLLDRHVKRYDMQVKELINAGAMVHDPSLPSLLEDSNANLAPISSSTTGFNTPVNGHGSSTTIADLARGRNFPSTLLPSGRNSTVAPVAGMSPTVTITNSSSIPAAAAARLRESSQGASDAKRRKLTASLNIPAHPSGLRQSSQGPGAGTPKATTPGASSRAGSAGPARTKKASKKPVPQGALSMRKAVGKRSGMSKKQRRLLSGRKGTPSTNDSSPSDEEMSDDDSVDTTSRRAGKDGAVDDAEDASAGGHDYDEEGDDTKYCICQQPSHGDMIACDNENCELEWFHWACVKLDKPPVGRWLCPNCRELPKTKVKLAR